ncbi:hypothetical protein [Hippea jasoniae]|uniref:hypothetical protein n=1 Tax=Hippea jasoniae TaxID=944479 RepID=UPI00054F4E71|nr:hypothetical protein [Hippea jasoniae]
MVLYESIQKLSVDISNFIKNHIHKFNGFNVRSFYGETFALNLLYLTNNLDEKSKKILISNYEKLDKSHPEFHWEFNNYALLYYKTVSGDNSIDKFIEPLIFKNTPCTNWTLLRSNARLMAKKDEDLAIKEAKEKIKKYQLKSGLILDDPGVKSFQYHCFSMAMIIEIYEQIKDEFFKTSFLKGVEFIRHFILSNGETLYIGRGQNQSFGYGTLIYILAVAYKYTNDKTLLGDIDLVLNFLLKFQREDGSFPLVMNGIEKNIPKVIDMQNPEFAGWYPYNNYFDYLPFMGFFLARAYYILKNLYCRNIQYKQQKEYRDNDFIKIVKPNYEAVLSRPGGYWTNDLPIPYVVSKSKNLTPCYGGEQFQSSLYSLQGIALPFCETFKKSIRWKAILFFIKNHLWIISLFGIIIREYKFLDDRIEIYTYIYSPFKFKNIYLELENKEVLNGDLKFEGYEYSASGRLKKYINFNKRDKIVIRVSND